MTPPRNVRIKLVLLLALAVVQLPATFLLSAPGHLSVDEGINHWMAKNFSDRQAFDVWNGYQEHPSTELVHPFFKTHNNRLYPPYPYLVPLLGYPFYRVTGFFGLFLMNSLCFMGLVALVFFIAKKMFQDMELALNACLILILGTFAWEYSQAAWPHAAAMFFVAMTFSCFVCSYYAEDVSKKRLWALVTGLAAGFAPAVRMDAYLLFPCLVLPFLFARPWLPREAVLLLVGTIPGLTALGLSNLAKFGVASPVSYGQAAYEPVPSWDIVAAAAAITCALWIMTRDRFQGIVREHLRLVILLAVAGALGTVFLVPRTWAVLEDILTNAYTLLVDMRTLDPEMVRAVRSSGGGVIFLGAHKKALLQSIPFLVVLLVPIIRIARRDKDAAGLLILFLVPAAYTAYYSVTFVALDAGGGLCLNHRYLLSCLPFLAILAAYSIVWLKRRWNSPPDLRILAAAGALTIAVYFWTVRQGAPVGELELPLLSLPLWIACSLLLLLVVCEITRFRNAKPLSQVTWAVLAVAMTWGGLVAFLYDYQHHRRARLIHHAYGASVFQELPTDSILFADNQTYAACMELIEKDRVRIAFPPKDRFEVFEDLLKFHLGAGRRAFAFFQEPLWAGLKNHILKPYKVTLILSFPGYSLQEISRSAEQASPPAPKSPGP